ERSGLSARRLAAAGCALPAAALAWCLTAGRDVRPAGFVLGTSILAAIPLVCPWAVTLAASSLRARSFSMVYGLQSLARRLGISSFTAASLAVAVSMLVGITIMVGSFRRTLETWVGATVTADVYVTTPSAQRARGEATLDPGVVEALGAHPDVAQVDLLRQLFADVGGRRASILGVRMDLPGGESRFALLDADAAEACRSAAQRGAVLVGEPLARRLGIGAGDRVTIAAGSGEYEATVAGVYFDYGGERGSVSMDLREMARRFGPGQPGNAALYLRPGADAETVVDELRQDLGGTPLVARSNRTLRTQIMAVFDQTFAVTRLLQAMSLLIALCGVTLALLVLARERVAELALYRALGASRAQVAGMFVGKGLGLALFGMLLGTAGGIALALILVLQINRAYFGWTIALHWPAAELAGQAGLLLAAAAGASLYPAFLAGRTPATELSRDDL
ncbi:MAG TPA: ABC transporter permease, partial [Candidatus Polarisedimenticolia bacterium]|nr:ABC transporter permease [Candidatus Polarisedimenticolia bacterium]